jgi:hypothetical protein
MKALHLTAISPQDVQFHTLPFSFNTGRTSLPTGFITQQRLLRIFAGDKKQFWDVPTIVGKALSVKKLTQERTSSVRDRLERDNKTLTTHFWKQSPSKTKTVCFQAEPQALQSERFSKTIRFRHKESKGLGGGDQRSHDRDGERTTQAA